MTMPSNETFYSVKALLVSVQLLLLALYADVKAGHNLPGVGYGDFGTAKVEQVIPLILLCVVEFAHLVVLGYKLAYPQSKKTKAPTDNPWSRRLHVFYETVYVYQPIATIVVSVAFIIYWSGHFTDYVWWLAAVALTFPVYVQALLLTRAKTFGQSVAGSKASVNGPRFTLLSSNPKQV